MGPRERLRARPAAVAARDEKLCKPGLPVRVMTQLRWFGVAVVGRRCGTERSTEFLASQRYYWLSRSVWRWNDTLHLWRRHADGVMKTCFAADWDSDGRQYCKHWESRGQFLQFSLSPVRCAARLTRLRTRPCDAATAGPRRCGWRHWQWHRPASRLPRISAAARNLTDLLTQITPRNWKFSLGYRIWNLNLDIFI